MESAHLHAVPSQENMDIPFQPASQDIWDKKYRLKTKDGTPVDRTVDETYKRVAKALAEVEQTPEKQEEWYRKFLWALRRGAIPAGRITSNAGALAHKPATSTINCTVSGTIRDSMDDILEKVHEAGLTLKAGCVAPDTKVVTEHGVVTARRAAEERHGSMLCYDRETGGFEMRAIERHMTTHVPRSENIEIVSNGTVLKTSSTGRTGGSTCGPMRCTRAMRWCTMPSPGRLTASGRWRHGSPAPSWATAAPTRNATPTSQPGAPGSKKHGLPAAVSFSRFAPPNGR
jgi:ribonucleotide reductase alpha subunit